MKTVQICAGAVISLLALFLAFRGVDLAGAARAASHANFVWLLFSAVLVGLSILLRAIRWQALFPRPQRLHIGSLFGVLNVGYLVNNVLPRAGELVRAILLGQVEPVSRVEAFSTIVVERVVDTLAVIILLFAAMPLVQFAGGADWPSWLLPGVRVIAVSMLVLLVALLLAAMNRGTTLRVVQQATRLLPERLRASVLAKAASALTGLAVLTDPRAAAEVIGLTGLIYLAGVAAMEAQVVAFHMRLPPAGPFFLLAAATLGLVVPAPGGIGVWEVIVKTSLTSVFAIEGSEAASLAVVSHVVFFAPPMLFAALYLWRLGASWDTLMGLTRRGAGPEPVPEP
ncbi:MAG TPA: lysylphosphatidylglycerol synthase transmembrane domain-containing protein [Dehalococcoidia bacterium]|nr:lysylphosphatidylglycerol synthase transmembrane domain-containing protein [Dehalococcoidia bacterium]